MHSNKTDLSYRRHGLGIAAIVCLLTGIYLFIRPPEAAWVDMLRSSSIRCGIVLLLGWLAFPQLVAIPGWMFTSFLGLLLLIALLPRLVPGLIQIGMMLAPVFVVLWLLRVKSKKSTR